MTVWQEAARGNTWAWNQTKLRLPTQMQSWIESWRGGLWSQAVIVWLPSSPRRESVKFTPARLSLAILHRQPWVVYTYSRTTYPTHRTAIIPTRDKRCAGSSTGMQAIENKSKPSRKLSSVFFQSCSRLFSALTSIRTSLKPTTITKYYWSGAVPNIQ